MVDNCTERRSIKRNVNFYNFNNINLNLNIIEGCDNKIFWRGKNKFFCIIIYRYIKIQKSWDIDFWKIFGR